MLPARGVAVGRDPHQRVGPARAEDEGDWDAEVYGPAPPVAPQAAPEQEDRSLLLPEEAAAARQELGPLEVLTLSRQNFT